MCPVPTEQPSGSEHRSWFHGVTRYQWLVLLLAWMGWVFDAMDATIYAIVLHPALHELLHTSHGPAATERIGWYGGIIFSIFLIGWAIGGITFGIAADRFGPDQSLDGHDHHLCGVHRRRRVVA